MDVKERLAVQTYIGMAVERYGEKAVPIEQPNIQDQNVQTGKKNNTITHRSVMFEFHSLKAHNKGLNLVSLPFCRVFFGKYPISRVSNRQLQ